MSKKSIWKTTNGLAILVTARTGVTAADERAWRADWATRNGWADEALPDASNSSVDHEVAARSSEGRGSKGAAVALARPVIPDELAGSGSPD